MPYPLSLLDFIAGPESSGSYNATYGHVADRDFSGMSLDEVIKDSLMRGRRYGSGATGRYQFMGKTLKGLKRNMGLSGAEAFTPPMQDALAMELLREKGLDRYLSGEIGAEQLGTNLSQVWAGLPSGPGGLSAFEGDAMGNSAGVSWNDLMAAIQQTNAPDVRMASGMVDTTGSTNPMDVVGDPVTGRMIEPANLQGGIGGQAAPVPWYENPAIMQRIGDLGTGILASGGGPGAGNWLGNAFVRADQIGAQRSTLALQMANAERALGEMEMNRQQRQAQAQAQQQWMGGLSPEDRAMASEIGDTDMVRKIIAERYKAPEIKMIGDRPYQARGGELTPLAGFDDAAVLSTKDRVSVANTIADDFRAESSQNREVLRRWEGVRKYDPNKMNQQQARNLIVSYAKALDPTSAVLGGEAEVIEAAGRKFGIIKDLWNKHVSGGGLMPEQAKQIMAEMEQLSRSAYVNQAQTWRRYNEQFGEAGISPAPYLGRLEPWQTAGKAPGVGQKTVPPGGLLPGVRSVTRVK